MNKIFSLIMSIVCLLTLCAITACKKTEKITIKVACPDGAPALAVYQLMKEKTELSNYNIEYQIVSGVDTIASMALNGSSDITVLPTNLAAKIYNGGAKVKLLSVNVFGVLYMLGKENITNKNELIGKVIVNVGRGGTPDLTLKRILSKNNIEYIESDVAVSNKVALTYVSAGSEAIAKVKTLKADYAVLGEPAVTQASKAIPASIVMNLQEEWNKIDENAPLYQAGIVISEKVYSNKKLVSELEEVLKSNLNFLIEDVSNISKVLTENGSALNVSFSLETINRCNLSYKNATEAKSNLENYYNAVIEFQPSFIGGALPDDNFYYKES